MKRKRKPEKKPGLRGGALFAISVLLLGSATIRFALEAGPALAREADNFEVTQDSRGPKTLQEPRTEEDLRLLFSALRAREDAANERERQIEDRLKALSIAETAIEDRIVALQSAEDALSATLALADVASEDDLSRLTSVYEKMKPKQAAALFEEMDPEFAAGFLARMRPEVAASIMAGLSPMAAYTLSVVLAGRNASVPKD